MFNRAVAMVLLLGLGLISGCATAKYVSYPPNLQWPSDTNALIKGVYRGSNSRQGSWLVKLLDVDSHQVNESLEYRYKDAVVEPGEHSVGVWIDAKTGINMMGSNYTTLDLNAEAGHVYQVQAIHDNKQVIYSIEDITEEYRR